MSESAPRQPIPSAFWLLMVFGLIAASIAAVFGFAIDDTITDEHTDALTGSQEAAEELISSGLFGDAGPEEPAPSGDGATPGSPPATTEEELGSRSSLPTDLTVDDGDPTVGQELFFANGCNICHGDTGRGGIGPKIGGTVLSLGQVLSQHRSPRDTMPAFSEDAVPEQDVAHIYAWLQSLE